MEAMTVANFSCRPPLNHNRLAFSRPISSLSVRVPPPHYSPLSVKASASSFDHEKPLLCSLLKSASTATVTVILAGTVFLARPNLKFAIAAPYWLLFKSKETAAEGSTAEENVRDRAVEDSVVANPNDTQELRNLMESKVMNYEMDEAIGIAKRLIQLEPEEPAWPLLKANFHYFDGDTEIAKREFNEVASKHPCEAEAYNGLIRVASISESREQSKEMKAIEKRVKKAMAMKCTKEQSRNLKLLIPQIRVIEGDYLRALLAYQELTKDEPEDFRPHLYLGIIFTLLNNEDAAEEHFQEYKRLVPQSQQYAEYFENNMIITNMQFGKKLE